MNPGWTIACATGHRPQALGVPRCFSDEVFYALVGVARVAIAEMVNTYGVNGIITGMALGWDQAVATAAKTLTIPFVAAVPFPGQEKAWPQTSQDRYHQLLSKAHRVIMVSDGAYTAAKMQARNVAMVDQAQVCMALWNGALEGGTANCMEYVQRQGMKWHNYWDLWVKLR